VRETIELVERARQEIRIAVDRVVVNQMPSVRATAARATLERVRGEPRLTALPPIPVMRAILDHGARRATEAGRFRHEVSDRCALPVVELPVWGEEIDAESGWRAQCDAVLATPFWPTANDERSRETGAA
jgi:hypothetical protein